jgi:hypothetical protein
MIINDDSVTRKLPQAIRFEAGSIIIRPYLMERNAWTEPTLDSINWDAHGAGHCYHQPYRCYLVKLCHIHLPMGKLLHRQDPKYSPTCPGCRDATEDQDHYLQCAAPSCIKWRIALITALRKQLVWLKTDKQLQETILNVIGNTLTDRAIPLTGPFQAALEAQSHIGWLGMLRGYSANAWQQAYVYTIHLPLTEERKDRNKRLIQMAGWQKKLVQVTWSLAIKLWTT